MKKFFVRLLLWLTEVPKAKPPAATTEDFLAGAWLNEGFRSYLYARERALEKYLSRGVSNKPVDNKEYLMAYGQLQEVTNLTQTAKRCYEAKRARREKEKLAKIN
jgi:hypothetical protein